MELVALYKRVIGLDVHQAQITACALIEECDGLIRIEQRQFGTFKKDRRALTQWVVQLQPDEVVMESTGIYWKSPYAAISGGRHSCKSRERPACQKCSRTQNRYQRCTMAGNVVACRIAACIVYSARKNARIAFDCPATAKADRTACI